MAFTEHFAILNDCPMYWDPDLLAKGVHAVRFHPDLPTRFAVVPRLGDGPARWFEAEPTYVLHWINAYEDGDEIVQAYVTDVVTSATWVNKALKGFARVHLLPGERKTVEVTLPWEAFQLVDADGRYVVEPGQFEVLVGPSSRERDLLKATLQVE